MKHSLSFFTIAALIGVFGFQTPLVQGSSHMDAPLITLDDAANTTDVYAFVSKRGDIQYLTTALAVYPFEEPGIGPNNFRFDDDVLYEIHISLGDDIDKGRATLSYQFRFKTKFRDDQTIRQSFLGEIAEVFDENQNLRQTYTVTLIDRRYSGKKRKTVLGNGLVPPNNQGLFTPLYNQNNNGENPAKGGVADETLLDPYTRGAIADNLKYGHLAFAAQRDDGFYADIQSIFDDLGAAFAGDNKPFDSQGGFNLHTIVLNTPLEKLEGAKRAGVYASTSRKRVRILLIKKDPIPFGKFVQVGRQGNPLFNEGFVALKDKDRYSRTSPTSDNALFSQYALEPELARLLGLSEDLSKNRTDLAGIFIPDMIKVDLTTGPARVPGDSNFNRLSIFGGDTLTSTFDPGLFGNNTVPGGFPNGRRFGDDVLDIAVCALLSDLRPPIDPQNDIGCAPDAEIDRVSQNEITFNDVFPYAATPLNGRNHPHHVATP